MRVVLIRHAHSQANEAGVLSGRRPNVHLSARGLEQAKNLAQRLGNFSVHQIRISPMERCLESIEPWLEFNSSPKSPAQIPIVDQDLTEVDYGTWSGKKLATLARNKNWKLVQEMPSRMYFPGGEGLAQMQIRANSVIHNAITSKKKGVLVVVSHGDVLKSIVASALGMHLDEFQRIIIDPASISILDYSYGKPRVLLLNDSRAVVTDLLLQPKRSRNLLGGGSGK